MPITGTPIAPSGSVYSASDIVALMTAEHQWMSQSVTKEPMIGLVNGANKVFEVGIKPAASLTVTDYLGNSLAIASSDVANVLRYHPAIYSALGLGSTIRRALTDAELASVMGVQNLYVRRHRVKTSAGATARTWDNVLIFAHSMFGGQLDGSPTFGITAALRGTPMVGGWMDMGNRNHGRDAKVIQSETPQILTPLAGYLFTDCLA